MMAEAKNKVADSNPAVPVEKKGLMTKEKVSKNVTCTKKTAYFLFLIAIASVVLSSFITYWVTKEKYDRSLEIRSFVDAHEAAVANVSMDEPPIEEEISSPTAAELRLPKDIVPIWFENKILHLLEKPVTRTKSSCDDIQEKKWTDKYNLTTKIYLPGYVEIPASKNMTFDADLIIKFWVDESTDKIVLNSLKLNFPENLEEIKILQDEIIQTEQISRARRSFESTTFDDYFTTLSSSSQSTTTEEEEMETEMESEMEAEIETTENEAESSTTPDMNFEGLEPTNATTEESPKSIKIAADVQVLNYIIFV
ncbi:unnamed protein product [Onchocerca flexuosa]|uniref:Uncharacterized protein n=1 Tax=Onchocerca flexuosa TaxID=387005 RepID=A0A183HCP5_9BILA|nr:unnamed protein product [Onchocerca flexuosa]